MDLGDEPTSRTPYSTLPPPSGATVTQLNPAAAGPTERHGVRGGEEQPVSGRVRLRVRLAARCRQLSSGAWMGAGFADVGGGRPARTDGGGTEAESGTIR